MNISVHIERLILDGVAMTHGQSRQLQAAVEAELTRLLATDGLSPGWLAGAAMPAVKAGGILLTNDRDPAQLGQQIAQAVYGAIGNMSK